MKNLMPEYTEEQKAVAMSETYSIVYDRRELGVETYKLVRTKYNKRSLCFHGKEICEGSREYCEKMFKRHSGQRWSSYYTERVLDYTDAMTAEVATT